MVFINLSTLGFRYRFQGGGPQAEMEIFTLCLFGNGQMCGRRHAAPWERDIYDGASDVRPTALLFSSPVRDLKPSVWKFTYRYIVLSGHQEPEQSPMRSLGIPPCSTLPFCVHRLTRHTPINWTSKNRKSASFRRGEPSLLCLASMSEFTYK